MKKFKPSSWNLIKLASLATVFAVACFGVLPSPVMAIHRPEGASPIANWNFKWSIDSDAEAESLAEWDVLIIDAESEHYSRDRLRYIKKLNPDIKILAYISLSDIRKDAASLDAGTSRQHVGEKLEENPGWVLKKKSGAAARWWPGNSIFNMTNQAPKVNGQRFNDWYADFVRDSIVKDKIWDGIFLDNVWEGASFVSRGIDTNLDGRAESGSKVNAQWRKGVRKFLKKTRKSANKNRGNSFLITGNGGTRYHKQLNGVGFEHFPNTVYGDWVSSMEEYQFIIENAVPNQIGIINSNTGNTGNKTDYQQFRFGLMSTLLDNGYYSFDNGDQTHHEKWYYDEYDIALGEPISGAYNVLQPSDPTTLREGVWRRDYEEVSVFVNTTYSDQTIRLNTGYEKFSGQQDPSTNSGDLVGSITIPARDGILLLTRLQVIKDTTFINGAFSKIFDGGGNQIRNSFFSYDGSFPGGTQVHRLSGSGKKVVANGTSVKIYNSRNQQIASFDPYGSGYSGGVNIAVGALYGGKKKYIVTGNASGVPEVKIYDMTGNLFNPGCRVYGDGFTGGVNVGVGDLDGDKKQEIVVAAGFGGGPHIRIFNNRCQLVDPGFFAFDQHLRIGVNMAVGDLNGDGKAEIIAASGPGGGPHIRIFNRHGKMLSAGFFAYEESDRSGVLVSTSDIDGDGSDEIVTSSFGIFNSF
ncbi:MAG: hypothetical protein COW24_03810 [Candidatus Kerfeldbacteria bacterium CG15_BIG_FIL_POST_REV_8_21_14_020_45_12]|uniref:Uncharacterized protein n=1 Tax=Candidatus Kerfeldbacteria bacterium CG15_BIG_FIL_POST_REV_8_21_14_020_45_12 TaxID=2014247 RepID=A0A2M7H3H6_9BACT|nr:MAG: hypothetical protein COW24_03810 [Candidatus Kerfeldbacteria bacterium CG15_BIG_FIL_POST_REV_8_21_14_020_45_12]PJA93826.1 MAG: hypothetical protein CO132_01415 [Candidatus Kerfeldbacteria bacterium CG_4_9_14_3_um_filter_45_8]